MCLSPPCFSIFSYLSTKGCNSLTRCGKWTVYAERVWIHAHIHRESQLLDHKNMQLSYALHSSFKCNSAPLFTVEARRLSYVMDTLDTHHGLPHLIRREQLFEDLIELYKINKSLENSRFEFAMTKRKPLTQVVFVKTCSVASGWMHTWGHLMAVVCSFQLSIHILTWQSILYLEQSCPMVLWCLDSYLFVSFSLL